MSSLQTVNKQLSFFQKCQQITVILKRKEQTFKIFKMDMGHVATLRNQPTNLPMMVKEEEEREKNWNCLSLSHS